MTNPQRIGCLLIHGFTSSPKEMAELADFLSAQGFPVHVPRLPGHATSPRDLLHVSHEDWLRTAEQSFTALHSVTQKQIVIGLSMGGLLALHLAANHAFSGVIALAPALKLRPWAEIGIRLLSPFNYIRRKSNGPDVHDPQGKALLDGYNQYPVAAARPLLRLQRLVRAELHKIKMPLLAIHSRQDHTIPIGALDYLFTSVSSPHREKMIVEDSYHVLTVDYDRKKIFARIVDFIKKVTDSQFSSGEESREQTAALRRKILQN